MGAYLCQTGDVDANYTRCLFFLNISHYMCVCVGGGFVGKTAELKKVFEVPGCLFARGR